MIDRVEELLELVEEQPDEDGQEDGLALEQETGAPVVPVSGPEEDRPPGGTAARRRTAGRGPFPRAAGQAGRNGRRR